MAGIQYRRARGVKHRSRELIMFTVKLRVINTGEQLSYDVLAFNEPMANVTAIEQAEKEGYKTNTIELVEIKAM